MDSVIAADSRKVFRKFGKHFLRNNVSPLLGAEDTMNENVWIPVCHSLTVPPLSYVRLCRMSHLKGAVPKRDSGQQGMATRHCRAGLSHAVPAALELPSETAVGTRQKC